ncbi:MAG: hypothetical protein LBU95_04595 [Rikenellaceae bacterium]|nr:hypothetical protein [Rikenellaceae bacterium]
MNKRIIGILTAVVVVVLIVLVSADSTRRRKAREIPTDKPESVLPASSPAAATPAPMTTDSLRVAADSLSAAVRGDSIRP